MSVPCTFCRIVSGRESALVIYEDEKSLAFLDQQPCAPGHALVILKEHGETSLDYPAEKLGDLWQSVKKVIRALEKTFQTTALTIGINHGELSGVRHLHVHLIPRFPGDGGGIIQSVVYNKPKESLETIQKKIKRNM